LIVVLLLPPPLLLQLPPLPSLGAALEISLPENQKKPLGFHVCKKSKQKNKQAKPTEQLWTTPKLLIFDFDDGDQNALRGQYYAMLPSPFPGFSNVVA
jgi:hypothetical protein